MRVVDRRRVAAGAPEVHVRSVLDSLRRTVRVARAAATAAEETLGISGAQHFALEKLAEGPASSLNELARRTLTQKSSLSVVVGRLVAQGLVHRARSPLDGRGVVLRLTPAGRRALVRGADSAQTRMVAALRRLPASDVAVLARLLERFTSELGLRGLRPGMLFEDGRSGPPLRADLVRAAPGRPLRGRRPQRAARPGAPDAGVAAPAPRGALP